MAHAVATSPAKARSTPVPPPVPCDADRLTRGYTMESGYRPSKKPQRTAH